MLSHLAEINAAFPWFFPAMVTVFGACVGSFLNVVIYRVPAGKSVVSPPSHCACGQPIKCYDNIPILSWLLLRGRARCCGRKFSFRYPFVELLTAALFVTAWLRFPPAVAACGWVLFVFLICSTFIDLDHMVIHDVFTVGLGVIGVLLSFLVPTLHGQIGEMYTLDSLHSGTIGLQGLLIGSGFLLWFGFIAEFFLKKDAMGLGDVLLVGGIGAFCGWKGAIFSILGGSVVGLVWIALAWCWKKIFGKEAPIAPRAETPEGEATDLGFGAHIPFGPMLAIAGAAHFLFFREWLDAWFAEFAKLF